MEPHDVDAMLRTLTAILAHQTTINTDLRAMLTKHDDHLARLDTAIVAIEDTLASVQRTEARMETLLTRVLRQDQTNGQEA